MHSLRYPNSSNDRCISSNSCLLSPHNSAASRSTSASISRTLDRESRASSRNSRNPFASFVVFLGRVHEAAYTQRLLSKIDQQTQPITTLMQVKQTLLNVFGQDGALGLNLQQQLVAVVPDDKVHSSFGYHNSVVGDGNFGSVPGQLR